MNTSMTRREALAAIGIATLVGCRRSEAPQPEQARDSTVTLTVDGML
jgi:hypothetical protein